jgi:hypothetical protein
LIAIYRFMVLLVVVLPGSLGATAQTLKVA